MTHPSKSPTKSVFRLLAVTLFVGGALAGCLTQDAEAASGELYVKDDLTDNASAVYITFTRAEVLPAQSEQWTTVYEGEETIEMLNLSGPDDKAKLSEFELQPGEYQQMRLTVTNVTVIDHEGNQSSYASFGNVVTVAHDFTVQPGGDFELLIDFDLEEGVDVTNQEYVPVIGFAQTTHKGGRDGNETNRTDRPEQSNAVDQRGLIGLCNAWENSAEGRTQGNATNSTAFTWLAEQAQTDNQTVDAYCDEQGRPGAPATLMELLPEDMPEQARAALEDRHLGKPDDPRQQGQADDRGADGDQSGNQTGGPGNQPNGAGNQTGGPGNPQSGNQTGGSGSGGGPDE